MLDYMYSFVAIVTLMGYVRQIAQLWKTTSNCKDISISTWNIWLATSVISVLYGHYELSDLKFTLTAGVNLVCISAIIMLVLRNRHIPTQRLKPAYARSK